MPKLLTEWFGWIIFYTVAPVAMVALVIFIRRKAMAPRPPEPTVWMRLLAIDEETSWKTIVSRITIVAVLIAVLAALGLTLNYYFNTAEVNYLNTPVFMVRIL